MLSVDNAFQWKLSGCGCLVADGNQKKEEVPDFLWR
jgi:hypothetical protein